MALVQPQKAALHLGLRPGCENSRRESGTRANRREDVSARLYACFELLGFGDCGGP